MVLVGLEEQQVEELELLQLALEESRTLQLEVEDPLRRPFLVCLVRTTPFSPWSLRPRSSVTAR